MSVRSVVAPYLWKAPNNVAYKTALNAALVRLKVCDSHGTLCPNLGHVSAKSCKGMLRGTDLGLYRAYIGVT